jgi:hypothetical protein
MKTKLEKVKYFFNTLLNVILSRFVKPKPILYNYRRVGNTTRLIDKFVQDFFIKGECKIYDHYNTRESKKRVFYLVLQRLNREHQIENKDVQLDTNKFIIRINNKK